MAYAAEGLPTTQRNVSVDIQPLYLPKFRLGFADMEHICSIHRVYL